MFVRKHKTKSLNIGSKESLTSQSSDGDLAGSREGVWDHSQLHRSNRFELQFLGMVQDVNLSGLHHRHADVQLVDKIEEAQIEGKISLVPQNDDQVLLTLSKNGLKILNKANKEVLQRHALKTVSQILHYTDSFNKNNLIVKISQVNRGTVFDCYAFRCNTDEQAKLICACLKRVFDDISAS